MVLRTSFLNKCTYKIDFLNFEFSCFIFTFRYDEKSGDHVLEQVRYKKWCCEKCPYATMKQKQFERHLQLHGSKQKYVCEYCDYSVPGYVFT